MSDRPSLQLLQGGLANEPIHDALASLMDAILGPVDAGILAIRWLSRRGERRLWVHLNYDLNCSEPIPGWKTSEPDALAQWYYSMLAGDRSVLVMGSRIARGVICRSWRFESGKGVPQHRDVTSKLPGEDWWIATISQVNSMSGQVSYGDAWSLESSI